MRWLHRAHSRVGTFTTTSSTVLPVLRSRTTTLPPASRCLWRSCPTPCLMLLRVTLPVNPASVSSSPYSWPPFGCTTTSISLGACHLLMGCPSARFDPSCFCCTSRGMAFRVFLFRPVNEADHPGVVQGLGDSLLGVPAVRDQHGQAAVYCLGDGAATLLQHRRRKRLLVGVLGF